MAILLKVQWVDQCDHPQVHKRLRLVGGVSGEFQWKHTHAQAVESIERGDFAYYFEKAHCALRLEVAQTAEGEKYLIVEHTGQPELLLELPGFPNHHMAGEPIPH